ncbi:MAG: hypothetical protein ABR587_12085 [Candidatus Binatia bacterium]
MKLESQPGWGAGLVTRDLPLHWELFFNHGGERKFVKSLATSLVPITISAEELAALETKAYGRHASLEARAKRGTRPRSSVAVKGRFATFDEQLEFFEKIFPGGFGGEKFTNEERGVPGAKGKAGHKEAAIAMAQQELCAERFDSATPEELFESAKKVLQATTIVFPMEGPIPFATMDADSRGPAVESLKYLLHGEGDYADRLQAFAGAMNLKDKKGEPKAVTWPFATIFSAFLNPDEFTCVKPTAFASQGATLGLPVEKSQPVTAGGYRSFAEIAMKTRELLTAAGQQPRDLMDVYSFIWRTHHEKPA